MVSETKRIYEKIDKLVDEREKTKKNKKETEIENSIDELKSTRYQVQAIRESLEIREKSSSYFFLILLLCFIVCLFVDGNLIYKYSDMSTIQEQIKIYSKEDSKIRSDISYIIETKIQNNNINIKKVNNAYTYLIMYPELRKDDDIYKLVESSQKYQDQILLLKLKYAKLKKYRTILFFV